MNRLEKVLYTAKAHTTGGARRHVTPVPTAGLEVSRLSRPGSSGNRHQPGATLRRPAGPHASSRR